MHSQQGPQSPHSKGTRLSRGTRGHSVTECLGDTEWPGPGIAEVGLVPAGDTLWKTNAEAVF